MVIAEVSVIPVGTEAPSVSAYVARAVRAVMRQKKVKYQLMAMGTLLEGDLGEVLEAVKSMHESVFGKDAQRVVTRISIDDRRDKQLTMDYKVQSVMRRLG
jgi:uncharacterized protein (TIGR00106 family)